LKNEKGNRYLINLINYKNNLDTSAKNIQKKQFLPSKNSPSGIIISRPVRLMNVITATFFLADDVM
jgi:hypothetical protein